MKNKDLTLTEIWIYPVKSLGGIAIQEAEAEMRGLQYDRRWMIVDEQFRFLSQREIPEMVFIAVELIKKDNQLTGLKFSKTNKSNDDFEVDYIYEIKNNLKKIEVKIWEDWVEAEIVDDYINTWLSTFLKVKCQLVYMPEITKRTVDKNYSINGDEITSFSDAYPYLIIGQESLNFLNSKLEKPITMNRFRPNFVFSGGLANEEETWKKFIIDQVQFEGVKNCARCPVPTIEPLTAKKSKEPLATLSSYNFRNNKVYFGQNLLITKLGKVKVGDKITLL